MNYGALVQSLGHSVESNGIWASVGRPHREYGWKLHISSIQVHAPSLLPILSRVLTEFRVPFKVARDADVLAALNESEFGATQVGKFMTIYPADDGECVDIAAAITAVTAGFHGPRIVTDKHIGGVTYARFGSHSPRFTRDRLGQMVTTGMDVEAGGYKVPHAIPDGVSDPFGAREEQHQDIETTTGVLLGPGYLLLKVLARHGKGNTFLAVDTREQSSSSLVVLKQAHAHCMSDSRGRDARDRLLHQSAVHAELEGKVPVARAYSLFEHDEDLYLPFEYVDGHTLAERPPLPFSASESSDRARLLTVFHQIATAVQLMHEQGFVHRDLSPRNVIATHDGIVLVDFEMSVRLDVGAVPFASGTPGFMSPQQSAGRPATAADDVYAFGALVLHSITGLDPRRMLDDWDRNDQADRIEQLSGAPRWLITLLVDCLSPTEDHRPAMADVVSLLHQDIPGVSDSTSAASDETSIMPQPTQVIADSCRWLLHNAPRDDQHQLWLSLPIESTHVAHGVFDGQTRLYRSAGRGVSGVLYTLARLQRHGFQLPPQASEKLNSTVDWLLAHHPTPDDQMPGLHYGEAGVAVAIAEAIHAGIIDRGAWTAPYFEQALSNEPDWPDLTHGAAGQGLAAMTISDLLDEPALMHKARRYVEYVLDHQRADGAWQLPAGVSGMEDAQYTGFAHGTAGIAYFLSRWARRTGATDASEGAVRAGEWLMKASLDPGAGKWPVRIDDLASWAWWCNGGPGIAISLLELYELTGTVDYAQLARAALYSHQEQVRYPNLSQCHGLAGLGECLLEGYRVLKDDGLLRRAELIARSLIALRRSDAAGTYWMTERHDVATADLMVGASGIIHFLARFSAQKDLGPPLLPDVERLASIPGDRVPGGRSSGRVLSNLGTTGL